MQGQRLSWLAAAMALLPMNSSADEPVSATREALCRPHRSGRTPTSVEEAVTAHHTMRQAAVRVQRAAGKVVPPHTPQLVPPPPDSGWIVDPVAYGADPSGVRDSTDAIERAVSALLEKGARAGVRMGANYTDLGGAVLDLQGGAYLLSRSLAIPPGYGNYRVVRGTLRASTSFPSESFVLDIGHGINADGGGGEDIGVQELLIDGSLRAAGGLRVAGVMGGSIGPQVYVLHFLEVGILIASGHELNIHESWVAQCYWTEHCSQRNDPNTDSVGIHLKGDDHTLMGVTVFDWVSVGIRIEQPMSGTGGNLLQGVHVWNGGTNGNVQGPGIAIDIAPAWGSNRLESCYFDFNNLVVRDPNALTISGSFFLSSQIIFTAVEGHASNSRIFDNQYASWLIGEFKVPLRSIVLNGSFPEPSNFRVLDEIRATLPVAPQPTKIMQTVATKSITQTASRDWVFNFTDVLLFDRIDRLSYSVVSESTVAHVAKPPHGRVVAVVADAPLTGTITVTAEQAV